MIFTYDYKPVIEDFSKDGKLSIVAVLKILENAGNGHSDYAGDSIFKTNGITRAWILTEWSIKIDEYPSYGDEIKAETWSEGLNSPLVANRDFLLYKNGKVCARGTSVWVLFDVAAQRLSKIDDYLLESYKPEDKKVFDEKKPSKIEKPEAFSLEKTVEIRRSDIDFNDHVHNLVYLDYAMQALPEEVYKSAKFQSLRVTYKTAVKSGDSVRCKYAQIEDKHIVFIYNEEDQLCTMIQLS